MLVGVHIDLITSVANLGFGGIFLPPSQVPPGPRCTPVVISTKLTCDLLPASLLLRAARASPPSAPTPKRRPGGPYCLTPAGLPAQDVGAGGQATSNQAKKNGPDGSSKAPSPQKAFEARDCGSCLRGRWPRDEITTCAVQRNAGRRQPPP
jgi:hypothetical protein